MLSGLTLVRRMQRVFQVDAGQDGENLGLDEGNQHLQRIDRGDRKDRQDDVEDCAQTGRPLRSATSVQLAGLGKVVVALIGPDRVPRLGSQHAVDWPVVVALVAQCPLNLAHGLWIPGLA